MSEGNGHIGGRLGQGADDLRNGVASPERELFVDMLRGWLRLGDKRASHVLVKREELAELIGALTDLGMHQPKPDDRPPWRRAKAAYAAVRRSL